MKRFFLITISIVLISAFALTGCTGTDRSGELREFLSSNEDSYESQFTEEECSFSDFADYMATWAKADNVDVVYQGEHSMVLCNPATSGYEDEPDCVLLCGFDAENAPSSKAVIATGQTSLLGPAEHGDIYLAVTEHDGSQLTGIEELPVKYLKCDNLITLNTGNNNIILTSGPTAADALFHCSAKDKETSYAQAYKITMSMPEYTDPFDFVKGNNYPNPINTIGSFLASSKSAGKLFDIASFTSESHDGYTPYTASAVIVVDSNHTESMNSRFEKSYSNIEKKFEDLEADFEYTMEETDMPKKVLSNDAADNLISLMYTLNTGVCLQDEESGLIYAASYIKSIRTDSGDLDLMLGVRARGESYLDSLSAEYETTAGLCSTKFSLSKTGRVWTSDTKSSLVKFFTGCVPLQNQAENAVSMRTYESDIIAQKLKDQNMIIYSFEKSDRKTVLKNITDFLDPSLQK